MDCHKNMVDVFPYSSFGEPLVFFCCDALTEVTSMIENPFKVENLCGYSPQVQTTLRVPYGTKSKYEETPGWNQFYRIEELQPTGIISPAGETEDGGIYDLSGRKHSGKPARGIYIEGGKKKVK